MKLKTKFLLMPQFFMILVIAIFVIFMYFYFSYNVFIKLENDQIMQSNNRLNAVLNQELNRIDTVLSDWTFWDDNYAFANSAVEDEVHKEFIVQNFYEGNLKNVGLDFMIYFDKEGNITFIKQLDGADNEIYDTQGFENFSSDNYYLFKLNKSDFRSGFILIQNKPVMISIRPILKSDGSGEINHYLMMGAYLDEDELNMFGNMMMFPVQEYDFEHFNFSGLELKNKSYVRRDKDVAHSFFIVSDINYVPIFVLGVDVKRDIFRVGLDTMKMFMVLLLIFCLTVIVITYIFGRYMFKQTLNQIVDLKESAQNIVEGKYSIKIQESNDELGELSKSFKTMAIQLKESRDELQKLNKDLERKIELRTSELEIKNKELESFNKFAIDRELKMIDLKNDLAASRKKIDDLKLTEEFNKLRVEKNEANK